MSAGRWHLYSKTDPRWNERGDARAMAFTAGMPREVEAAIKRLKETLGEPPDDLEYSCMKD